MRKGLCISPTSGRALGFPWGGACKVLVSLQDVCEGLADVSATWCAAAAGAAIDKQLQNVLCKSSKEKQKTVAINYRAKNTEATALMRSYERLLLPEFRKNGATAPLLPNIQWTAVKSIISSLMVQSGFSGVYRKTNITECKVWGKRKAKLCNTCLEVPVNVRFTNEDVAVIGQARLA